MRSAVYFLLLFPLFLWGREGDIYLSTNFENPLSLLGEVQEALGKRNIKIELSELNGVKNWNKASYIVIWNKPEQLRKKTLYRMPKKKAVLFQWDSPNVSRKLFLRKYMRHFRRIYTWNDDLVDNDRIFKFYFPALKPMIADVTPFEKKKLLTLVAPAKPNKKALDLNRAIQFFEKKGYSPELAASPHARFTVCYEDITDGKGYITEKIFNAFAAGTVPIYLGATNVTDYIPKECFIDPRDFTSEEEMFAYLQTMDRSAYENRLEAIRKFLQSEKAQLFSPQYFQVLFLEAIHFP